jgi:ParB-like chromosome segregation protein Spo0J
MNPADKIERRAIEELIPYARNSRTHSDAQVAQIAASIKEWGWTMPILVDEAGGIIAGHGRLMAARSLGHEDVPVVVASGWSEAKKRAYVIADNKLALNAGWDFEMLAGEIEELNSDGYELELIGFNAEEMNKVINPVVASPPDDFNEYGDDIETAYKCPKCSYEWSGKAK